MRTKSQLKKVTQEGHP